MAAMSDEKTYTGGCHCGRVRYEVRADLGQVVSCNCSICSKTGALYAFVPAEQLTLLSGEDALADYQFHKKVLHHLFCTGCGIRSFGRGTAPDGTPMCSINVRCLDDVDLDALNVTRYDGKSV